MPFPTPHPQEDDAWRVSETVAHYYGWGNDWDGQPKCGAADLPAKAARQATASDPLCPDCEGWYALNVTMPWLG
jgi:hypothetical protein